MFIDVLKAKPSLYAELKSRRTKNGVTFAKCIKTGFDNKGHTLIRTQGLVAGDADSYEVFREVFDPVIAAQYPTVNLANLRHYTDMDSAKVLDTVVDPAGGHLLAVSAQISRNLAGLRMPSACSLEERREAERLLVQALTASLEGDYLPIAGSQSFVARPGGMSHDEEKALTKGGIVFKEPDSEVSLSSGFGRHWPDARGIYFSDSGRLVAWLNQDDHVRLMLRNMPNMSNSTSSSRGGQLKATFSSLSLAHAKVVEQLQISGHGFAYSDRLGYLSSSPVNVGTCLHLSVSLKLPLLSREPTLWEICQRLRVAAVPTMPSRKSLLMTSSRAGSGILEVSNLERLGSSEVEQVNLVIEACRVLIELEMKLEGEAGEAGEVCDKEALAPSAQARGAAQPSARLAQCAVPPLPGLPAVSVIEPQRLPGLGAEEFPGFPADTCPDLPDLSNHFSIVCDILRRDPSIYTQLRNLRTRFGVSLAKCIKTGMDNRGHSMIKSIGAVAGDAECYELFRPLFDPVIRVVHSEKALDVPHCSDMSWSSVHGGPLDPSGKCIVSTRMRIQRNLAGLRMPPACSYDERREVERVIVGALGQLTGNLAGQYFPLQGSMSWPEQLGGMSSEEQSMLAKNGILFNEPDAALVLATGVGRDWPDARGVFVSSSRSVSAWINEEDHFRLMLMQQGCDLKAAFQLLCGLQGAMQDSLASVGHEFAHSPRLGFLTACPSNIGTGLRVNVTMRLPLLSERSDFKPLCLRLRLQARASRTRASRGLVDVSNTERLGVSEADMLHTLAEGLRLLVELESRLSKGSEELDLSSFANA